MKTTGVVRRIDDLGRIVIPKEIRRTLKINEGDSLEILVDDSSIVLRKYLILDNITNMSRKIVEVFFKTYKENIIITDKEKIIASSNKEYINEDLSNHLKEIINKRLEIEEKDNTIIPSKKENGYFLVPIISNSDVVGSIIMVNDKIDSYLKDIVRFIRAILIKNIEE